MRPNLITALLGCLIAMSLVLGALTQNITDEEVTSADSLKKGKIFSLFSIVTFKNTGCRSQSALPSGQSAVRNGTCYTSSECASKGGTASGNCAAGFGVCCLFIVSTSGGVVLQNCSYIQNPGYPSSYTGTTSVTYTVQKCSSDVCFLRLDFEAFNLLGPSDTTETAANLGGTCLRDTFKVTTTTGQASTSTAATLQTANTIPTICGLNTGQHIYVDMGNQASDTTTLSFAFTTTTTTRNWEIKVTQVECSNPGRPPNGCLQYLTTLTGRITTFNFLSTTSTHLGGQDVTVCIRRQDGYCCVQYQVCANVNNPFTLGSPGAVANTGYIDTYCTNDYVMIPGSSGICSTSSMVFTSRYCGSYLNITPIASMNIPICDCTSPFTLHFHTDATIDTGAAAGTSNRGDCLDYQLLPCTSS